MTKNYKYTIEFHGGGKVGFDSVGPLKSVTLSEMISTRGGGLMLVIAKFKLKDYVGGEVGKMLTDIGEAAELAYQKYGSVTVYYNFDSIEGSEIYLVPGNPKQKPKRGDLDFVDKMVDCCPACGSTSFGYLHGILEPGEHIACNECDYRGLIGAKEK